MKEKVQHYFPEAALMGSRAPRIPRTGVFRDSINVPPMSSLELSEVMENAEYELHQRMMRKQYWALSDGRQYIIHIEKKVIHNAQRLSHVGRTIHLILKIVLRHPEQAKLHEHVLENSLQSRLYKEEPDEVRLAKRLQPKSSRRQYFRMKDGLLGTFDYTEEIAEIDGEAVMVRIG